ncbi:2-hydroxyacid dehydrogenase [Paenibacillus humicola]|uniref:2-hydroxyacid dehydrogenase n=1 Tax=Paenibacillus humicola TaxID=3110540 RepID=UPI00237C2CC2|nr:NAD(P)-dependent oxidoreductase [Paenibacillus humicola]
MKIVYVDEPTYLPDSFVRRMEERGEFEVYYDRPDEETAVRRLSGADLAIVEWTPITARMLKRISRLRYIALVMTAYDLVDCEAAGAAGIPVSNCPAYSAESVAEHVFALLLAVNRRLGEADAAVRRGESHLYGPFLGCQLAGKTFGVIGTGRIGQAAAKIAAGFGMKVIGTNRSGRSLPGIERVELPALMKESDIVTLHAPSNRETKGLLSKKLLALMKPSAFFVNTSRAGLVDENELYALLRDRRIAGAGLDDVSTVRDNPLYALDNVVLTPGTAWYTDTARDANLEELIANIDSFLNGAERNIVNREFLNASKP